MIRIGSEVCKLKRMGRPKSDNPKIVRFEVKLTKSEAEKLQHCADSLKTSKADVVLRGLNLVEVELNKQIEQAAP